ncbi:MAG: acyl-CoA dehydrogenase family protein [Pseudomonadales bacterium]|nr:acyl-CoA dehydrogenase family protein [Pseudomonadales bacterium]
MHSALPPEAVDFRNRVRAFLDNKLDDDLRRASRLTTGVYTHIEAGQRWYRILAEQGWSAPTWPVEWGGTGWSDLERYLFSVECFRAGAPLLFNMGVRHIGPLLIAEGSREQQRRYLPRILSGEDVWCQGYSEPGAGSDLASLKLKARRDGDDYVLNGSKIWTTGAHFATHMFALVRTSDRRSKQEGITFLLLSMNSPGLTVEPILSISGDHEFNQVYFDQVRVPVANRVGAENDGWQVAKLLMQHARSNNVNTGWVHEALARLRRLVAQETDGHGSALAAEPGFARRLNEAEIFLSRVEVLELRVLAATQTGASPGAISSVLKTLGSEVKQQITELAAEAVGYYGLPFQPQALDPFAGQAPIGPAAAITAMPTYLNERAATIYSGASEIQRDVLAKRVLGL